MKRPLSDAVAITAGLFEEPYPELEHRTAGIAGVVRDESERCQKTLEQGLEQFEKVASRHDKVIPGADAFRLHDTFGFPVELTKELATDRGLQVDEQGFQAAMAGQKERSRRELPNRWKLVKDLPKSEFAGYHELTTATSIVAVRKDGASVDMAVEGEDVEVFLERTPFYAESGGQVGDTGTITTEGGRLRVEDTQKPADGVIAHLGAVVTGELRVGEAATAAGAAGP